MNPKEHKSSKILVFGFGCSCALIATALYFHDVESDSAEEGAGQAIGFVADSNNDVSRRLSGRLLWAALPSQRRIFENDTIRTGAQSSVNVDLGAKGSFQLKGDSLVVLETQQNGLRVNVASGDLFLKGSVVARIGTTEVSSNEGLVRVSSQGDKLVVQTQKGSASITDGNKKTEVKEGSEARRNPSGTISVKEFPVIRAKPTDATSQHLKFNDDPVIFELRAGGSLPPAPWLMQISKDPTFKANVIEREISSIDNPILTKLPEGNFHWRVIDVHSKQPLSSTGNFDVFHPPKLEWKNPNDAQIGILSDTGVQLTLEWNAIRQAEHYSVHFFMNGKPVEEVEARRSRLEWRAHRGPLEAALRSSPDAGQEKVSVEIRAHLRAAGETPAPTLLSKVAISDGRHSIAVQDAVAKIEDPLTTAHIAWLSDGAGVSTFEIDLSGKMTRQKETRLSVSSKDLMKALLTSPKPRIRVITPSGAPGPWTEVHYDNNEFAIVGFAEKSPIPLSPLNGSTLLKRETTKITIAWRTESNSLYTPLSYDLILEGPKGFKKMEKNLNTSQFEISDPVLGTYTWKVRAQWKDFGWGPFNEGQHFTLTGGAPIRAPRLRIPASQGDQDL